MNGVELIKIERKRQVEIEGWTAEHDARHYEGDLAVAALCYIAHVVGVDRMMSVMDYWPWDKKWWKPTPKDPIKQLVKAGALIAAEIDKMQSEKL